MTRILAFHLLLLALGVLMALWGWRHVDPQDIKARTVVLHIDPADIRRLEHDWPGGLTRLEPQPAAVLRPFRMELLPEPPAAVPGTAPPTPPPPLLAPPSHVVQRGLALLSPLRARRVYPAPDAAQRSRLGFEQVERRLRIETDERTLQIEFGLETFGGDGRYIRVTGQPEIYLVDARLARSFEGPPTRLSEAQLVPVALPEVRAFEVELGGRTLRLRQRHAGQARLRHFVDSDHADRRVASGETMLGHLQELYSRAYVDSGDIPAEAELRVRIDLERRPQLAVSLHHGPDSGTWWLRSGPWAAELHPVAARKLLENMRAAWPLAPADAP